MGTNTYYLSYILIHDTLVLNYVVHISQIVWYIYHKSDNLKDPNVWNVKCKKRVYHKNMQQRKSSLYQQWCRFIKIACST